MSAMDLKSAKIGDVFLTRDGRIVEIVDKDGDVLVWEDTGRSIFKTNSEGYCIPAMPFWDNDAKLHWKITKSPNDII